MPPDEPLLRLDDIQGNILVGFKCEYEALLFLKVLHWRRLRPLLKTVIPRITSADEIRKFRGGMSAAFTASPKPARAWLNFGLAHGLLRQIRNSTRDFSDAAFNEGLARRSPLLGDPLPGQGDGEPGTWIVGGPNTEADLVLHLGCDTLEQLNGEIESLARTLTLSPTKTEAAAKLVHVERGWSRSELQGREHFGFKDEISQPRVRGRLSQASDCFFQKREDLKSPQHPSRAPELIWPGEFVFGYPCQSDDDAALPGKNSLAGRAPKWARNGTFMVIRRLRQDVHAFHNFVHEVAVLRKIPADQAGAMLVGRWTNGCPFGKPADSHPELDRNDQDNAFSYHPAPGDNGALTILPSAHIRQMHPRGISSTNGNSKPSPNDTHTHRIIRRGFAYGAPSPSSVLQPVGDAVDRGLIFISFQTSIENQFEFIVRRWANEPNFPEPLSGIDPIIGQDNEAIDGWRTIQVGNGCLLRTKSRWVTPTGGGYFFVPSLSFARSLVCRQTWARA